MQGSAIVSVEANDGTVGGGMFDAGFPRGGLDAHCRPGLRDMPELVCHCQQLIDAAGSALPGCETA